jgi:hypothetical protein
MEENKITTQEEVKTLNAFGPYFFDNVRHTIETAQKTWLRNIETRELSGQKLMVDMALSSINNAAMWLNHWLEEYKRQEVVKNV